MGSCAVIDRRALADHLGIDEHHRELPRRVSVRGATSVREWDWLFTGIFRRRWLASGRMPMGMPRIASWESLPCQER